MAELRIFVSSSMSELPDERAAVQRAVDKLEFEPFLYENDAHAGTRPAQEQWERVLTDAHVCLVIIYRKLGEYTRGEIDFARNLKKQMLVYRRTDDEHVLEQDEDRAAYMAQLEGVKGGVAVVYFARSDELEERVFGDLHHLLTAVFERLEQFERGEVAGPRRQGETTPHGLGVREEARPGIIAVALDALRRVAEVRGEVVGRDDDVADLVDSIQGGDQLIAVTGPYGIGRKTVVRYAVHNEDVGSFGNGVGVSPADRAVGELEDMLQAIWETFFEVAEGVDVVTVVDPRKRQTDLEKLKALVVIEDGRLSENDFEELAAQLRDSTIVVTTDQEWRGDEIPLDGLADPRDMQAVFEAKSRLGVPEPLYEQLASIFVDRLGGSPYLIEKLAQQAKKSLRRAQDDVAAWGTWVGQIAAADDDALQDLLVTEEARAAFDAVRTVGTVVPIKALEHAQGDISSAVAALEEEAVEAASPRVVVNPALAELADPPEDEAGIMDTMLAAAIEWAEEAPTDEIFENREFVLRMLDWGRATERWHAVIRLAKATEAAMGIGGRHGAWRRVLEDALEAARRKGDGAAEGWALHQLGSMALVRDELDDARELLHDALEKREQVGDEEGAQLSRDNLGLIPMAIMSLAALVLILLGFAAWIWAVTTPEAWAETRDEPLPPRRPPDLTTTTTEPDGNGGANGSSFTISSPDTVLVFPGDNALVEFTVTNDGGVPLKALAIEVADDTDDYDVSVAGCDPARLEPDADAGCSFVVTVPEPLAAELTVPFRVIAQADDDEMEELSAEDEVTLIYPDRLEIAMLPQVSVVGSGSEVELVLGVTSGATIFVTDVVLAASGDPAVDFAAECPVDEEVGTGLPYICPITATVEGDVGGIATITATVDFTFADEPRDPEVATATIEIADVVAGDVTLGIEAGLTGDIDGDGLGDAGDQLTFTYTIVNVGQEPLDDLELSAPLTGADAGATTLDGGEVRVVSATYTITAADVAAGQVVHTATVTAVGPQGEVTASDVIVVPLLEANIRVDVSAAVENGVVAYDFTILNEGNVALTDIQLTATGATDLVGCSGISLPPGQQDDASCTATQAPTTAELTAGEVTNVFTLSATAEGVGQLSETSPISVPIGVVEVSLDITTAPADVSIPVVVQDARNVISGGEALLVPVGVISGDTTTATVVWFVPDDWTLTFPAGGGDCDGATGGEGPAQIEVVLTATAGGGPLTCAASLAGEPILEIQPNVLRFPPDSFSITNEGTAAVTMQGLVVDPVGDYVLADGCTGVVLFPGNQCSVGVTPNAGAGLGVIEFDLDAAAGGDSRVLLIAP